MTKREDSDGIDVHARRAGMAVRVEALAADGRMGPPVQQQNRRTVWAASALGLVAAAVFATFVVTSTDEPKATVTVQEPSSVPAVGGTTTAVPSTTVPLPLAGGEPAYPGCAWDGSEVVTAPQEVSPPCNGLQQIVTNIAWATWTDTEATGAGTVLGNDCAGACADEASAEIRLTEPAMYQGHFVFTKMRVDGEQLPKELQGRTYDLRNGLEPPPLESVASWRATFDERDDPIDLSNVQRMVDERQESWRNNPYVMTLQFGRMWFGNASETFDIVETTEPSADQRTFVLTKAGLGDDSVGAVRLTVHFGDGPEWKYVTASSSQRCQPGRGHQDFTAEPCV